MGNVGCPKVKKGFIWRIRYVCFFWKPLIAITDHPCYDFTVVGSNLIFYLVLSEFATILSVINLDYDPVNMTEF